jgi:nickel transport protein
VATDCAALLVSVSSGYWSKTPWETRNLPKDQVSGALKSWLSEESVKRIARWSPGADRPLGKGLEITPATDPLVLKPGDKLVVLVTEDGKPKAGLPVAYGGDTRGATGEDGRIAIRIRQGGVQLISTSLETPLADGKADQRIRSAALQFDLPQ